MMREIIEVKGKKYEECGLDEYLKLDKTIGIQYGKDHTYYKEVKEEFESALNCIGGMYAVNEDRVGVLTVGCTKIRVEEIENLLKEYKEWKEL